MRQILITLTLVTLFVSCNRGGDTPLEPAPKRVAITPTITRATELSFEQGDKIGLTILRADQSAYADNAPMIYADGVFVGDVAWYEESVASKMVAYYPYSSAGMPTSFSVSPDQTTGYGASDLMGAMKSDVVPTDNAVGMMFYHLMSKIIVRVQQTDTDINSVVLRNSIPTANVDLKSLTVEVDKTKAVVDITAQAVTANSTYRAVIVPQTTSLTLVVTTTQGKTYTQKLLSANIEGGGQYGVSVELVKDRLKVSMSGDIENWTNEGELKEEQEENPDKPDYELRTLTFEDADYKGASNTSYWSSLIDKPQYGGPLLYGNYSNVDYKWFDDKNTFIAHELPENYDSRVYWGGGHAISDYVETDVEKGAHDTQLAVFFKDQTTEQGGHNGSKNFCVHYGYKDGSSFNQIQVLPSFYFKDGTARVVDHMYVMVTTYLANCIINGNSLTEPCGPNDWIKVVATGYDATGNKMEGNELEFSLTTGILGVVMSDWQRWDLSALGKVSRIEFNIKGSSDNGYGFSQPAYFAYDDIAVRFEN